MRGGRSNKPYTRPSGNPDAPGSWKHDLHQSTNPSSSLADRLSGSSRGSNSNSGSSLLSRISGGQRKELLPQGHKGNKGKELFGFGTTPPLNGNNANAGVELLGGGNARIGNGNGVGPTRTPRGFQAQAGQRSLAQNGINAALGIDGRERRRELMSRNTPRQSQGQGGSGVSILGAGSKSIVVRVSNLAQGTTAEDVVSAFAPVQFINATVSSTPTAKLVSVDLELSPENKRDAEGLIDKYDGQIADGNKLNVSIVRQPSLGERMQGQAQGRGQELITPSSGKMYSDTILQSDPRARIQTVAEQEEEARNRQRADVWQRNGGGSRNGGGGGGGGGRSLASRLGGGGGGHRGSGGRGGMMID